jgi:predicted N-acetyltransferase YhbS
VKAGMKMRDSKLRSQLFERIEDLHARSAKVFVVAGDGVYYRAGFQGNNIVYIVSVP